MAQIIKNRALANITEFFFIFAYHEKPRTIMTHLSLDIPPKQELGKQIYNALQGSVIEMIIQSA